MDCNRGDGEALASLISLPKRIAVKPGQAGGGQSWPTLRPDLFNLVPRSSTRPCLRRCEIFPVVLCSGIPVPCVTSSRLLPGLLLMKLTIRSQSVTRRLRTLSYAAMDVGLTLVFRFFFLIVSIAFANIWVSMFYYLIYVRRILSITIDVLYHICILPPKAEMARGWLLWFYFLVRGRGRIVRSNPKR